MTQRPTTVRYRVLAWLTLAAAFSYVCRNAVGVAESTIREDLGLTLEQSGWFMGAFFWTDAVFQVPSGWFSQPGHPPVETSTQSPHLAWIASGPPDP